MTTEQLLGRRAAAGDQAAFEAIYRHYHQEIYRYCRAIVRSDEDARDALQNTMLAALQALPGEKREIAIRPWLYRVAHNEAISLLRKRVPLIDPQTAPEQAVAGADVDASSRERFRGLVSDLQQLPARQRSALVMRELSGLSFEEIGAAIGSSSAAARQTVYEARVSLSAMKEGREMDCVDVRRAISDGDGRTLRGRSVRAHLRSCEGCADFRAGIEQRRTDLAALFPPLPALAASGLLAAILSSHAGGAAGGVAAAGATSAGGVAAASTTSAGTAAVSAVPAAAGVSGVAGATGGGLAGGSGLFGGLAAGGAVKAVAVVAAVAIGAGTASATGVVHIHLLSSSHQTTSAPPGQSQPSQSSTGSAHARGQGEGLATAGPGSANPGRAVGRHTRRAKRRHQAASITGHGRGASRRSVTATNASSAAQASHGNSQAASHGAGKPSPASSHGNGSNASTSHASSSHGASGSSHGTSSSSHGTNPNAGGAAGSHGASSSNGNGTPASHSQKPPHTTPPTTRTTTTPSSQGSGHGTGGGSGHGHGHG
jgi:RNA polymerase sigma factor (sigma-70 family)